MATYKQSHAALLDYLATLGWRIAPTLKVRHATSPDGTVRLWLKPQAVYISKVAPGRSHTFGEAHSTWLDARAVTPERFLASVHTYF